MTVVADTSFVLALMDAKDIGHGRARDWYAEYSGSLVTTPLAVAEMDHLIRGRIGRDAARALEDQIEEGSLIVRWWPADVFETIAVSRSNPRVGLSDASLVVLASRLETTSIATFDLKDFRKLRPLTGEAAFTLLPADAR